MLDRTEQDMLAEFLSLLDDDWDRGARILSVNELRQLTNLRKRLQRRLDDARNVKPCLKLEEMPEDGNEMAANIAKALSHQIVDNGIGSYEFWGARGFDSRKEPELQECHVWVQVTGHDDYDMIPARGRSSYEGGGCDGEHKGPCKDACTEVEVEFSIDLCDVAWTKECDLLLCYNVEQE